MKVLMLIVIRVTRPEIYWQLFVTNGKKIFGIIFFQLQTFLHNGKILLIKKQTYQNIYWR